MNTRWLSIAIFVVGIMLIVWGFHAEQSVGSDISRFFTGSPTDRTIWLFIVGGFMAVAGMFGSFRWPNRN